MEPDPGMFQKVWLLRSPYQLPIYLIEKPGILRDRHAVSPAFMGRSYTGTQEELGIRYEAGRLNKATRIAAER